MTVPEGVTTIGDGAFNWCDSLASVTIPDSVTAIGHHAFGNCSSLASVTVPASVTDIGEEAFANCSDLTLTVGLGSYAEQYCRDNDLPYVYAGG